MLKMKELEAGKLKAEPLELVISVEEAGEEEPPKLTVNASGELGWSRCGRNEVPPPATSEQLRFRFKLIGRL